MIFLFQNMENLVSMQTNHEFVNQLRLEILYGTYVELDQRWKRQGVCDSYTRVYYIHSGEGYLRQNEHLTILQPGYAYLIPSGCKFDYGCTKLTKLFFHITLTATEGLDLLSALPGIGQIPFSQQEWDELMHCYHSDNYMDLLRVKMRLYQTILTCAEQVSSLSLPIRKYSELVQRSMQYIRSNLSIRLNASAIAKALFVSDSRLRKAFRAETGIPLGKYIDELLFLQAKQLLTDRSLSIGQISQSLGFCDQFYFSRRFKEKYHQTPLEYRKETINAVR